MSRTHGHGTGSRENGRKFGGYEYWGRRPGPRCPGKFSKHVTHPRERLIARTACIKNSYKLSDKINGVSGVD